ncbi:hypothetical protein AAHA92_15438 [Salvia divinorum]|uniref:Ribosomal protein L18ae family n=1 Tax=Salvia divinorum TaxID=28513 RepID=A0ABD1HFK4_SALDI
MYSSGPYFGGGRPVMNPHATAAFYNYCYRQGIDPRYGDEVYRQSMIGTPKIRAIPTLFWRPKLRSIRLLALKNATIEEGEGRNGAELVRSVSEKHLELLRPSARCYSIFKGQTIDAEEREKGKYTLIRDEEDSQLGLYDKPLPCFGCGIGWFFFLVGFLCPLTWYYAAILYLANYYRKDPRERAGLAASAIAAMVCSVILLIVVLILLY